MDDNIIKLIDLIENQRIFDVDFNGYDRLYPYTTENLKGYLPDVDGKNVLSVSGSGDHYLNLAFLGARTIDSFDINLFSLYYLKLKKAAILAFQKSSFDYFMNCDCLSCIEQLKPFLDTDTYRFWNFYVQFYAYQGGFLSTSLFYPQINKDDYPRRNYYLDKENYLKLQNTLLDRPNEEFYHADLYQLPSLLNKKYDAIFLSNIVSYQKNKKSFLNLLNELSNWLNDGGSLYYGYYYRSQGSGIPYYQSHLENTEFLSIPSVYKNGADKDKVLVLKKEKKK